MFISILSIILAIVSYVLGVYWEYDYVILTSALFLFVACIASALDRYLLTIETKEKGEEE